MSVAPIVRFDRVHGRDAAGPGARARGTLDALDLALGPGVHAFLGAPEDGLIALVELLSGLRAPTRGRVVVAQRDPSSTPSLRARIGALGAEPRLPPASTVGAAVRLALRARGEAGDRIDAVLDPLGLAALHARTPRSLSFAEARAVELGLALTTPAPILLALYEPLADVALAEPERVRLHLRELAASGVCVVIATSSPADARSLADHVLVLHQGRLIREARGEGTALALGEARLVAWVRPASDHAKGDVRALAAALAQAPTVHALTWEDAPVEGPGVAHLELRGESAEVCAAALIEAALATDTALEAFAPAAPDLTAVRAATDTLLRMHWAALRAAALRTPASPERPAFVAPVIASPAAIVGAQTIAAPPSIVDPVAVAPAIVGAQTIPTPEEPGQHADAAPPAIEEVPR